MCDSRLELIFWLRDPSVLSLKDGGILDQNSYVTQNKYKRVIGHNLFTSLPLKETIKPFGCSLLIKSVLLRKYLLNTNITVKKVKYFFECRIFH